MLNPIREVIRSKSRGYLFEVCDSVIALLAPEQIDEWFDRINNIPRSDEYGVGICVFEVDGKQLTIICDSGMFGVAENFHEFCQENDIPSYYILDSPVIGDYDDLGDFYIHPDDNPEQVEELLQLWFKVWGQ